MGYGDIVPVTDGGRIFATGEKRSARSYCWILGDMYIKNGS